LNERSIRIESVNPRSNLAPTILLDRLQYCRSPSLSSETAKALAKTIVGMHIKIALSKKVAFIPNKERVSVGYAWHLAFVLEYQRFGGLPRSCILKLKRTLAITSREEKKNST
jgi:hypothetical protein